MGAITIFWKDGIPCGTCPAGHEKEWLQGKDKNPIQPDRQTSSTDDRWHDWARARADKKYGGGGMTEEEAQRLL